MRIAFVTYNLHPYIGGGSGVYARYLTREIAKRGNDVVVFAPSGGTSASKLDSLEGVELRRVRVLDDLPYKALQFWLRLPEEVRIADREGAFDVVHFNGISYWFARRKISRAPQISTIHHLVKDAVAGSRPSMISRLSDIGGENGFLMPIIEKRSTTCSNMIIAVSRFTYDQILSQYPHLRGRVTVVQNGVEFDRNAISTEMIKDTRARLGIPRRPVVLFVGRTNDHRKGLDTLLKAFEIIASNSNAVLLIVGRGGIKKVGRIIHSLRLDGRIIVTGHVDDDVLMTCYMISDVFVCPSRLEGFGLTVLEAMAAGKPIVASSVGAIPELVQDNENGFLVSSENPNDMAERILRILGDTNLRDRFSRNNLNRIRDKYTWGRCAEMTLGAYDQLLENPN
jgi:glycosyltransferase involved in cell wall biosynthesis